MGPPEFGGLSKLKWLDISRNALIGGIPPELGGIPPELGGLSNLGLLLLSGNDLSGCVPSALTNVAGNDLENLGLPTC